MKPSDFRPSSSPRFMVCPGSVVLSAGKPDSSSEYAAAGSAQHKQAEMLIRNKLFKEECTEVVENESVLGYVEWATSLVQPGDTVLIEQRVSTAEVLGVPGASGTLDFAILRADEKSILIADRKFPWGKPVYAAGEGGEDEEVAEGMLGHPPLMIYALGALDSFDGLFLDKSTVEVIEFAIYQENAGRSGAVDTWKCTVQYLESFRSLAKAAVKRATVAATHHKFLGQEGGDKEQWAKEYLRPGNTQCKYCKAKADLSCPAVSKTVLKAVAGKEIAISKTIDLADWELSLAGLSDAKTEELYELLPLVSDWMKAVKFQMHSRMRDLGVEMTHHKLVDGRMGNRKWSDSLVSIDHEEAYERVLLGPTALEKKVKKKLFPQDAWEALQPHIVREPGKPTIAKKADEREVVSLPAVEEIPCDLLPPVL